MRSTEEKTNLYEEKKPLKHKWRRSNANIFSSISFFWLKPFIQIGQKRNLTAYDIDELSSKYKANYLLHKFKAKSLAHILNPGASVFSIVFSFINKWHYLCLTLLAISTWLCYASLCIFLRIILQYLDGETHITTREAYLYSIAFSVVVFVRPIIEYVSRFMINEKCAQIRTLLTAMLYEKALKLPINTYNTSHIVSLLSDDIQKFDQFLEYIPDCVGGIVLLPCLFYIAYDLNNWYIVLGLGVILFFTVIISITTPKSAELKRKILIFTDQRLKLIKEAVIGYLNTKMYSWEPSIYKLVTDSRKKEVEYYIKRGKLLAMNHTLLCMGDTLIIAIVSLAYFYTEGALYISGIYPVLILYNYFLLWLLGAVPLALQSFHELKISIKRIPAFLRSVELKQIKKDQHNNGTPIDPSVCIENVSFCWPSNGSKALSSVHLSVDQHGLYGIVGKVGSGKTAMLMSIIGELESVHNHAADAESEYKICGKIGYCSQVAWIFNASVKENILFGNKYDAKWYNQVIGACGLDKDLMEFPHSDDTIIGERGINLSGGQKTRINLARCMYDKPDIMLLDDILSSVDSIVSKHIFDHVLSSKTGIMKNGIIVIVTHQIDILPLMKKIFVMENGSIIYNGDYKQLSAIESVNITDLLNIKHAYDQPQNDNNHPTFISTESEKKDKPQTEELPLKHRHHLSLNMTSNHTNRKKLAEEQSVVQVEKSKTGSVPFSVYLSILFPTSSKCMRLLQLLSLILLLFSAQIFQTASQYYLALWATIPKQQQSNPQYVITYVSMVIMGIVLDFIRFGVLFQVLFDGSLSLHNKMFGSVLNSSMRFFESNPVGRILNRFSQDQLNVDDKLPVCVATCIWIFWRFMMVFILVGMTNVYLYIIMIPMAVLSLWVMNLYLNTSRSLRRLEATTKSPIYSYFAICSSGLCSIRSYNKQQHVLNLAFQIIEENIAVSLIYIATKKWIAFTLDIFMCICTICAVFICIYFSNTGHMNVASVGLTLVYFIWVSSCLSWGIRQFADTENYMTSTERIVEYGNLQSEENELCVVDDIKEPPSDWPKYGTITINHLSVAYRDCFDSVLKNINVVVNHGEKIGIVGRTGSGKSTLFKAIYRFLKFKNGSVNIDGVDISSISLLNLRKCLFIIPQNCILFSSTLRYNLDPFDEYHDEEIYEILDKVQLNIRRSADGCDDRNQNTLCLDTMMTEHGVVSVGESQLICIARAMLNYKKSKILLMDEATANIDKYTDQIIQKLFLQNLFQNKTVLTIAHRINTIINYDKVLVLDKGNIIEFDTPHNLLQDNKSLFYRMYHKHN